MSDPLLFIAQQFSGLPIDSLIGGPLIATTKANANMAFTQTQFLLDNCFKKVVTGSGDTATTNYEPIMIQMNLTNNVITPGDPTTTPPTETMVTPFTTVFNLPILTIMPLNSLAVNSVDVNFEMEVQSSSTQNSKSETTGENGFEEKVGWGPFSVTILGSASYDSKESITANSHYKKNNTAKYSIAVHAGQMPLPQGVLTIIDAYSKNISPVQLPPSPKL